MSLSESGQICKPIREGPIAIALQKFMGETP